MISLRNPAFFSEWVASVCIMSMHEKRKGDLQLFSKMYSNVFILTWCSKNRLEHEKTSCSIGVHEQEQQYSLFAGI